MVAQEVDTSKNVEVGLFPNRVELIDLKNSTISEARLVKYKVPDNEREKDEPEDFYAVVLDINHRVSHAQCNLLFRNYSESGVMNHRLIIPVAEGEFTELSTIDQSLSWEESNNCQTGLLAATAISTFTQTFDLNQQLSGLQEAGTEANTSQNNVVISFDHGLSSSSQTIPIEMMMKKASRLNSALKLQDPSARLIMSAPDYAGIAPKSAGDGRGLNLQQTAGTLGLTADQFNKLEPHISQEYFTPVMYALQKKRFYQMLDWSGRLISSTGHSTGAAADFNEQIVADILGLPTERITIMQNHALGARVNTEGFMGVKILGLNQQEALTFVAKVAQVFGITEAPILGVVDQIVTRLIVENMIPGAHSEIVTKQGETFGDQPDVASKIQQGLVKQKLFDDELLQVVLNEVNVVNSTPADKVTPEIFQQLEIFNILDSLKIYIVENWNQVLLMIQFSEGNQKIDDNTATHYGAYIMGNSLERNQTGYDHKANEAVVAASGGTTMVSPKENRFITEETITPGVENGDQDVGTDRAIRIVPEGWEFTKTEKTRIEHPALFLQELALLIPDKQAYQFFVREWYRMQLESVTDQYTAQDKSFTFKPIAFDEQEYIHQTRVLLKLFMDCVGVKDNIQKKVIEAKNDRQIKLYRGKAMNAKLSYAKQNGSEINHETIDTMLRFDAMLDDLLLSREFIHPFALYFWQTIRERVNNEYYDGNAKSVRMYKPNH